AASWPGAAPAPAGGPGSDRGAAEDRAVVPFRCGENRGVLLEEIVRTSAAIAETSARLTKIDRLASLLRRLRADELPIAVAYLSAELPQGTIGVGWASLRDLPPPAATASLEILDVHSALDRVPGATGPGSQAVRRGELADLFGRATEAEQRFLA